jgi:molecular chaperone DnaK
MEYCVITMPTTFKARYTAAIKQIAKLSGLQIVGLLDEPTASAYTFGQTTKADHTIAVYDLGGGTFDFAILRRKGGEYETIAQMGDAWLGGDDFDQAIIEFLLKEFQNSTKNRRFANGEIYREGIRITNKDILRAIRIEAENAKCALSDTQNTMIHIPNVIPEIQAGCDMNVRLSRDLLEYVVSDKIEQTVSLSLDALENASTVDSGLKLDSLVVVGGQARMPRVRQRLKEVFGDIIYEEVMPDEAVAFGATIYGNTVALGG